MNHRTKTLDPGASFALTSRLVGSVEHGGPVRPRREREDRKLLGAVRFGPSVSAAVGDVPDLIEACATEVWSSTGSVHYIKEDGVALACDREDLFGALHYGSDSGCLRSNTEEAYEAILRLLERCGYPHLYRVWNYIANISDAGAMDRYRSFAAGRLLALERAPPAFGPLRPAATCVGTETGGVTIYFLARRRGPVIDVENPRQTPAWRYPRQYGAPPAFSRATYVAGAAGEGGQLFVSGTASIIGHETVFAGDIAQQCVTTFDNLRALLAGSNLSRYGVRDHFELTDLDQIKVYVRRAEDVERVRRMCSRVFSPRASVLYLRADICRSDLLVEVEGICGRPRPS